MFPMLYFHNLDMDKLMNNTEFSVPERIGSVLLYKEYQFFFATLFTIWLICFPC